MKDQTDAMDRLTNYVRVFSADDNAALEEQINEEIEDRGGDVSSLSIALADGQLVAIVSFKNASLPS